MLKFSRFWHILTCHSYFSKQFHCLIFKDFYNFKRDCRQKHWSWAKKVIEKLKLCLAWQKCRLKHSFRLSFAWDFVSLATSEFFFFKFIVCKLCNCNSWAHLIIGCLRPWVNIVQRIRGCHKLFTRVSTYLAFVKYLCNCSTKMRFQKLYF